MTLTSSDPGSVAGSRPEAVDEVPGERRFTPGLLKVSVFGAFALMPILVPSLPQNLAFGDVFIMVVIFLSLVYMIRQGSPATAGAVKCMPWIWLILLGSYLGLATVGVPLWSTLDLVRGMLALLTLFCFWHMLYVMHLERYAIRGTAVGFLITTAALIVLPFKYRGVAFFAHPNYAGHYVVLAGLVLVGSAKRRWVKVFWAAALLLGLWKTGSFGAVAMLFAVLGVLALRTFARNTAVLAVGLAAVAIVGLILISPATDPTVVNPDETVAPAVDSSNIQVSTAFTSDRFDKSQGSRFLVWSQAISAWTESPLGVGPDGVRQRAIGKTFQGGGEQVLEVHADAIGYLVERGVIGLIGFIGLWVVLFRLTRPGGLARLVVVASVVAGLFRETMHYRQVWLLLALALVLDARSRDDEGATAAEPEQALRAG